VSAGQLVVDVGTGQLSLDVAGESVVVHYDGRGAFLLEGEQLQRVSDYLVDAITPAASPDAPAADPPPAEPIVAPVWTDTRA
jgi:hypothetical protein